MTATAGKSVNIVGGGIAGLIAAIKLARGGLQVRLFEAAGSFGGRARTREVDGFHLNQGPHALYLRGAFHRELKALGVAFSGKTTSPDAPQALWRGKLHPLPGSAKTLVTTGLFTVSEKVAYVGKMKAVLGGATGEGSFADWLDEQKLSPALRASLEALARVTGYTNAPELVSAAAMLDQMRNGLSGVLYLDGGWGTLVKGLADQANTAGVQLHAGARVERVAVERGQTRLTLAEGAVYASDATVLALGPQEAAGLLSTSGDLQKAAREATRLRANTLDLALSHWPEGGRQFVLGIDRPLYASLHSDAGKLAPPGGAVVHLARYLAPDEQPQPDAIEELEQLADVMMPGWRAFEVRRQELRGMAVAHGLPRWDRKRPGVAVADTPGLFLAGDWVGEEGFIADAAAASGAKSAEAVLAWIQSGVAARAA